MRAPFTVSPPQAVNCIEGHVSMLRPSRKEGDTATDAAGDAAAGSGGGGGVAADAASGGGAAAPAAATTTAAATAAKPLSLKGTFQVFLGFNQAGLICTPEQDAVLSEVNAMAEGVVSTVAAAPRLLLSRAFAYLFPSRPTGLNPVHILRTMPRLAQLRQDLNAVVSSDFAAARDYSQQFNDVRKVWTHGQAWSIAEYK